MGVVGEIGQMGVMRGIVPALYKSIVDIEPVIAVGSQCSVPPLLADVQAAAVNEGQSEADMVRVSGWQEVNRSDQLTTDHIGSRNAAEDIRHEWAPA